MWRRSTPWLRPPRKSPYDRLFLRGGGTFRLILDPTRSMNGRAVNFDYTKPYFNMTIAACRAAGRRGGRRAAMNRRQLAQSAFPAATSPEPHRETAHEASTLLDQRFPHLRSAWV